MNKLFDFAFKDRKYRFRAYAVSAAVALIVALTARLVLRWTEPDVIITMTVVFCASAIAFILFYVPSAGSSDKLAIPTKFRLRYIAPSFVTVAVVFAIISASADIGLKVQTFVVNLRLASVSGPTIAGVSYFQTPEQVQAQLRNRFQRLQTIADISYRYQIPVDPKRLLNAQDMIQRSLKYPKLSEETNQAGLIAAAKLASITAQENAGASTQVLHAFLINSNMVISKQKVRFLGSHSLLAGDGRFIIDDSTVLFDGVDFRGEKPFRESFLAPNPSSTVVVRNSTIENIDQPLDGITWIDVQFKHSVIETNGGPFALVNVSFNDCDLRRLAPFSPVGIELQEKITKANGNPISYAYEGYVGPTQKH